MGFVSMSAANGNKGMRYMLFSSFLTKVHNCPRRFFLQFVLFLPRFRSLSKRNVVPILLCIHTVILLASGVIKPTDPVYAKHPWRGT